MTLLSFVRKIMITSVELQMMEKLLMKMKIYISIA